ncbi:hypothetical protein VTK73DRAFT_2891 [Phialemonium thermophilum]|uniref:Zn(2)-C6 fungal-type domain-containing protein n=1 Tax=Phialemonium thermophilum TaxID=223376 RepID=A0ABR3X2S0_9PEZI
MSKSRVRNFVACYDCHRQKVRCSGEQPCQRCRARQKECLYFQKEAVVPVPESSLRRIEDSLNELKSMLRSGGSAATSTSATMTALARSDQGRDEANQTGGDAEQPVRALSSTSRSVVDPLVDDSTAESFVRKVRELLQGGSQGSTAVSPGSSSALSSGPGGPSVRHPSPPCHAVLKFDTLHSQLHFKLPPYPYAIHLATVAEQEFGDYHTFLRKLFWKRLHATYDDMQSQSRDRNWLCRLSLVLALAEAGSTHGQPISAFLGSEDGTVLGETAATLPASQDAHPALSAGVELFEQGLVLLKVSYEEPTVDDVEALNLASHCSYVFNRRRSAYAYAGQSIRLARCLGLDRPPSGVLSHVEREHRKRVWWTAFCVDRASSAELGLAPTFVDVGDGPGYPTSSHLAPDENEEFYDPELLTAQIQICEIKSHVVQTVGRLKSRDIEHPYEILGECLAKLEACKTAILPAAFSESGSRYTPSPSTARIRSSIMLRYNQCYILLLRPILVHQCALLLRNDKIVTISEDIRSVNHTCLQAARSNIQILLSLAEAGRLVRYGYWDSVHLFSSLAILSIANLMAHKVPSAFPSSPGGVDSDVALYQKGRTILHGMVRAGNIPSRHHLQMLEEVESIGDMMCAPVDGDAALMGAGNVGTELGFDRWDELMMPLDVDLEGFDVFASILS